MLRWISNEICGIFLIQADDNKDGKLTLDEMLDHDYIFYSTVYDTGVNDDNEEDYHDEF